MQNNIKQVKIHRNDLVFGLPIIHTNRNSIEKNNIALQYLLYSIDI